MDWRSSRSRWKIALTAQDGARSDGFSLAGMGASPMLSRRTPLARQMHGRGARATMRAMRILGIDPGLQLTGYGVIDFALPRSKLIDGGVIRLNAKTSIP